MSFVIRTVNEEVTLICFTLSIGMFLLEPIVFKSIKGLSEGWTFETDQMFSCVKDHSYTRIHV